MEISSVSKTGIAAIFLATFLLTGCSESPQPAGNSAAAPGSGFSDLMDEAQSARLDDIPPGSAKAVTPFADIEVEKATGANSYRVGEIFARGPELAGETVRVRAQVVKFSPAIMNRNFIHLQDGSGDPGDHSHNLVATSDLTVATGDIVTLEGVLAADKDFGAGYTYRVLLEESQVIE